MASMQGKVAIVAAAGTGIGAASAKLLAAEGCQVTVADIDGDSAQRVAGDINRDGGTAIAVQVDVSEEAEVKTMIDTTVQTFGGLDVLHNNAAPMQLLPRDTVIDEIETVVWDRMFAVIARGAFLGCKHAIPHLRARGGGSIINTSSMAGERGTWTFHAYGSAKAAVNNLTRNVATMYGPDRIRCNAVSPGLIVNPERGDDVDQASRAWSDTLLVPRVGVGHDIARAVVFLAADDADYITGQILNIDGGVLAWGPWGKITRGGAPDGAIDTDLPTA